MGMMTKLSPRAHAIMEAYYIIDTTEEDGIIALLRELVNQLKYIGITEKNILEIADELEAHYD
jgi:DNA-binding transcriptional regulator YhcF (GntR family)